MKLTAAICVLTAVMLAGMQSHAQNRQTIDENRLVSANERITLDVMQGDVVIRPGNDNTFRVAGVLDEQAEGFELESSNGFTRFIVVMPRGIRGGNRNRDRGSDLEITVPANSNVEFVGVNAAVEIADVLGGASVTTVNGTINARGLREFIHLKTVNGRITSDANRGHITIETVNGEVRDQGSEGRLAVEAVNGELNIVSRAEEVKLAVVNGEIRAELTATGLLELRSVNGQIRVSLVESASPRIRGSSVSGGIDLRLDRSIDARFNIASSVGRNINNSVTSDEASRPRFGPGTSLQFSTGQGAGSIDLTTVSGPITIRRD